RRLAVCTKVRNALRQHRLLFAFQPVVCATTGKVDYFECLLRMRDVEGSIVSGGHFITPIEQLGLIGFIDDYVLEQTLQELANHPGVKLGLNVSGLTVCDGSWLQSLTSLLGGRPDLARRLVVEITETAALVDTAGSARFVDTLRDAGCRVALDDYGSAHTSPRQLQVMAVDTVKIDGSYIQNLADSREKQALLRDMLGSINAFGCATVIRPPIIVVDQPGVEIGLQLVDRVIDLLAERNPVKLVQDGAMKALADAVRLRALGLGAAVIDVLDRKVELIFVALGAAKLGAAVSQHARQPDAVLIVEWHHPVVEDLGRGDRGLTVIELGKGDFGIGIDDGLLIDPADAL